MKLLHLTLGLMMLLPGIASAGEFWRFETEDGVVSFVDDAKKIPEKYREVMMSFLPLAKTRPVVTSYPTASEYYDQAFQEAVLGEKDAETALADAVKNVADFVETSGF